MADVCGDANMEESSGQLVILENEVTETKNSPEEKVVNAKISDNGDSNIATTDNLEPQQSGHNHEPMQSEQNLEPTESELNLEPQQSEQNCEPKKSELNREPTQSELNREPTEREQNREPQQSEQNREPTESEQNRLPTESELNREPTESELNREPTESELNREPTESELNCEPTESELNREPTESALNREPQQSELNCEPTESEQNREPQQSELNHEPQQSEQNCEPTESELNREPQQSELNREPQQIEQNREPVQSGQNHEPIQSEQNCEPTDSEQNHEPMQSEENRELTQREQEEARRDAEEKRLKDDELQKYWAAVEENPVDFTGWTYLLQYVEQENNPENCCKAYEAFFSHYPYCYGYWKKYSDVEKKHGNKDKAKEVFEKGVKAIPLSVELWLHYINFFIAEYGSEPNSRDKIMKLYERALAAAGLEFRSDKLWDSFISWENTNANLRGVTAIYERLIRTPTQLYSHHWDNYKRHINNHHPKEILDVDTFLKFRSETLGKSLNYHIDDEQDVGLDEVLQPGETPDLDAPPGMLSSLGDEKEVKKIRAKFIETREAIFKANEVEISKRWTFEESIRRPYFHVKPLERGQLKNWRDYLDFEIAQGDHKRTVVLFERSMIACALYEDFWMKYAKYLELHSMDGVRSVYQRACDIHLPKKPYIHLAWAAFEERRGNYALARKILMNIEKNVPGLAMVCMRRISLERRSKNNEAAEELFKTYIEKAVSQKTKTFFSIKYARYLQKVMRETARARQVLLDILDTDNSNEKVFLQLLDLEYQCQPTEEDRVLEVFSKLLQSDVSMEFKVRVSQRRMEFLEDFGTCIQKITDAYDEHQKLVKEASIKKKRPDKEQLPDEPAEKKQKVDPIPCPPPPVLDHNVPLPMPPMGPPPPPDVPYGYAPWPNAGYGAPVPNAYPGYPYPSYPMQYNYYGY